MCVCVTHILSIENTLHLLGFMSARTCVPLAPVFDCFSTYIYRERHTQTQTQTQTQTLSNTVNTHTHKQTDLGKHGTHTDRETDLVKNGHGVLGVHSWVLPFVCLRLPGHTQ